MTDYHWVLICPACEARVIGEWDNRETVLEQSCSTPGCQWAWEHLPSITCAEVVLA